MMEQPLYFRLPESQGPDFSSFMAKTCKLPPTNCAFHPSLDLRPMHFSLARCDTKRDAVGVAGLLDMQGAQGFIVGQRL